MLKPLYPHQERTMLALRQAVGRGKKRPVVNAPTGSGKTVLACHVVTGARGKDNRVAFVVPAISLIDQTYARFIENGIPAADIGITQADHPMSRPHAPIQICSVQTLAKRGFPMVDVVIVDECHLQFELTKKWLAADPQKLFIGLTATPWAKGMADHWDALVQETGISELIDAGRLCKFRAFAPAHPERDGDLKGVKIVAGDYAEGELGEAMSKPKLVADIVQTWIDRAENRKTLVFCVNRAHAALVNQEFNEQGVRAEYVDALTDREERGEIIKRLEAGETQVICSIGTMTTGVDIPSVSCIVYARPTRSEILYVQSIGRGLRTFPGKDHLLILDHSDTTLRLGTVDQIHHDELLDGKAGKNGTKDADELPLPKECASCGCIIPVRVRACPNCGAQPRQASGIETVDGELVEFGARAAGPRSPSRHGKPTNQWTRQDRIDFMGELRAYGEAKGYRPGWAAVQYKERMGDWPEIGVKHAKWREPTRDTLGWVKSRLIAYQKLKQSEGRRLAYGR